MAVSQCGHSTHRGLGLTASDFELTEQALEAQWGFRPGSGDVFWRLANQQLHEAMLSGDWHRLSMTYFTMGLHLKDEGRDHIQLRHQANDAQVRHYMAQAGTYGTGRGVQALADSCCDGCRKLNRLVVPFEEALRTSPLPPDSCTRDWCNCGWTLALDGI